jgi:hypothetical protein
VEERHVTGTSPEIQDLDVVIDTTRPHPARVYDWFLGGKDNYPVDEELGRRIAAIDGGAPKAARANRAFMRRTTRALATERGIRQFLDIGTGIPTEPNLHQVAQSIVPDARVVYVDNDPIVLAHAQALLTSSSEGRTAYIDADATEPESILDSPELAETLDLTEPVALSLNALLHFVPDDQDPYGIVDALMDELPSGSALAISHSTHDFAPEILARVLEIYRRGGTRGRTRGRAEVERFFDGLTLVEPGVVPAQNWRPDPVRAQLRAIAGPTVEDSEVNLWAGVAFKP